MTLTRVGKNVQLFALFDGKKRRLTAKIYSLKFRRICHLNERLEPLTFCLDPQSFT
ncbi:hypothetical protein NIES2104_67570 [Leptolyngbya sp. NIES-2104]|nr:hypothetical protein NIES2104_67570 [Leptolyngbya sp. NIES-2104]